MPIQSNLWNVIKEMVEKLWELNEGLITISSTECILRTKGANGLATEVKVWQKLIQSFEGERGSDKVVLVWKRMQNQLYSY